MDETDFSQCKKLYLKTYLKFNAGAYVFFYYHIFPVIRFEKPEKKNWYLVSVYPALSSKMLKSIQQHYDINLGVRGFGSDYYLV